MDHYRTKKVKKPDLKSASSSIADNKRTLAEEDDPDVRKQLKKTIADSIRPLQTLQNLEINMEKADYRLDSTISSLGTIYSQLLLVGSKDESGGKLNRLQEEISEQVHQLNDLSEAMDEVYSY